MKTHIRRALGSALVAVLFVGSVSVAQASSLTSLQVSSIINLLQAFGANPSVIANVQAALSGQPATSNVSAVSCGAFSGLKYGDRDTTTSGQVSQLQAFLGISPTTGYYGVLTRTAYGNRCVNNNVQPTAVAGMSQYTDADFGFSFWYPSSWTVSSNINDSNYVSGETIVKTLVLHSQPNSTDITIVEVVSSDKTITDLNSGAGAVSGFPVKYYFDSNQHVWMTVMPQGTPSGRDGGPSLADTSNDTMGGLHMFPGLTRFDTYMIPLSASNFVVLSDTGEYAAQMLAKTIVAADPSVATPVSTAQQVQTIQAEVSAYGVQQTGTNGSANLVATPVSGASPLTVSFSGSVGGSKPSPTGVGIYDFSINFGDGSYATVSCPLPYDLTNYAYPTSCTFTPVTHTYASAGVYAAALTRYTQDNTRTVIGSVTITVTNGAGGVSAVQTYINSPYGFSVQYPNNFTPGTTSSVPWWDNQTQQPLLSLIGSNDVERVNIGASANVTDVANCITGTNYTVVSINGVPFHMYTSTDPALGQEGFSYAYTALKNNICYRISMGFVGTEVSHLSSQAEKDAELAAEAATFKKLDSVAQSFHFTN